MNQRKHPTQRREDAEARGKSGSFRAVAAGRLCVRLLAVAFLCFPEFASAQQTCDHAARSRTAHSTGADWHLKGEGVVCCPCAVPCPCRTNGGATYGHCEATLYLRIREGYYGKVSLDNLNLVDTSGPCGMSYEKLSAIYLDPSTPPQVQEAILELFASFSASGTTEFPHVREAPIHAEIKDGHLFHVTIPEILEMVVDRNWGQAAPPLPAYAAQDRFANALQYVQNIRYRMHDDDAKLHFDYSRRQANYRSIDLDAADYRARRMIVQYLDGAGWFNAAMLQIIREQHLLIPDLEKIREDVARLRQVQGGAR
jgi:hypothetical protein